MDHTSFLLGFGDGGLDDCLDPGLDSAFTSQADGASKRSAGIILMQPSKEQNARPTCTAA